MWQLRELSDANFVESFETHVQVAWSPGTLRPLRCCFSLSINQAQFAAFQDQRRSGTFRSMAPDSRLQMETWTTHTLCKHSRPGLHCQHSVSMFLSLATGWQIPGDSREGVLPNGTDMHWPSINCSSCLGCQGQSMFFCYSCNYYMPACAKVIIRQSTWSSRALLTWTGLPWLTALGLCLQSLETPPAPRLSCMD